MDLELWKKRRKELGLRYEDLAEKSGVSKRSIEDIFRGYTTTPRIDTVEAIERALGLNEKSPLVYQGGRGVKIPVYGEIAAGIPIEAIEDIIDFEEITPEMAATGEYIALKVKGDSMAPRILEGDVVIIRRQETIENNEIAAVMVNGDSATLKKIKYAENGLWLMGYNPSFQPIFYSKQECANLPVRILGKMVEFRGKS